MKNHYSFLYDQVTVHLLFFGCFQIPCRAYFSLSDMTLMHSICCFLLGIIVLTLIIRMFRIEKNVISPYEETGWKSPLYPSVASLCSMILGNTPGYYAVAALLAIWAFYLLFKTVRILKEKQSL